MTCVKQIEATPALPAECQEVYYVHMALTPEDISRQINRLEDKIERAHEHFRNRFTKLEIASASTEERPKSPYIVPTIGSVLGALVLYLSWIGIETNQNGKSVSALVESVGGVTSRLIKLEQNETFRGAAGGAKSSLEAIPGMIKAARQSKTPIDPAVFAQTAPAIAHNAAYSQNPAVSAALSAVLGYQSLMNLPMLPPLIPNHLYAVAQAPNAVGVKISGARFATRVPWEGGMARYEPIGSHHYENAESQKGPDVLLLTGGTATLDGLHLKNVVFKETKITYRGGSIDFQSVWFVDCTFDIQPGRNGEGLGLSILSSAPSNFRSF